MNELPKNWLTEMPFDYEFKYYVLLAQIKRHEHSISEHRLHSTLENIESSLTILYDIKYAKDSIEREDVKIIGIDFDNMEIKFDYPEDISTVDSMYDLCDVAIELYEKLHTRLRIKWRSVSDTLRLSNIGKNPIKNHGFLYIRYKEDMLIYAIEIPIPFKTTWKDVNIKYINSIPYDVSDLSAFIEKHESGIKHYRCDLENDLPIDDCIIPVLKSILYKNLF
tara:strand:- start:1537 stop:2202 length:666 start_codon:yes stop_codon:yes gene_type:complete